MIRKLVFVFLFLAGHALAENAAFDPKTNVLTLPSIMVDTKVYSTTQVALPVDGKWSLIGMGAESPAVTADTAVFDVNSNVLTVPALRVGARLYSPTQVALPANGNWATVRVGTVSAAPTSTLAVTPTSVIGKTEETVKFNISGGTPPYVVSSSDNFVASVGNAYGTNKTYFSTAPTGVTPQAVASVIVGDKGAAQVWVTDAVGDVATLSVTSTGAAAAAQQSACQASVLVPYYDGYNQVIYRPELRPTVLTVSPTTITANIYETLTLSIGGGTPPYNIISSRNSIATVSPVAQSSNPCQTTAIVSTLAAGSVELTAMDSGGAKATVTIAVTTNNVIITPFAISPTTATVRAGAPIKISIIGGRPPYQVSSSYNFVAYPDKGTYESSTPNVEATIRTRSPGTATITVSEADGHQATVAVTVTP